MNKGCIVEFTKLTSIDEITLCFKHHLHKFCNDISDLCIDNNKLDVAIIRCEIHGEESNLSKIATSPPSWESGHVITRGLMGDPYNRKILTSRCSGHFYLSNKHRNFNQSQTHDQKVKIVLKRCYLVLHDNLINKRKLSEYTKICAPNAKPDTAMVIRTSVDGCRSFIGTVDECIDGFVNYHSENYPTRGRVIIRRRKKTKPPTFSKSIDTELRKLKNKSAKGKKLLNVAQKELFEFDLTKYMRSLNLSNESNGFSTNSSINSNNNNDSNNNNNNKTSQRSSKQSSISSFFGTGQKRSIKRRKSNNKHSSNNNNNKSKDEDKDNEEKDQNKNVINIYINNTNIFITIVVNSGKTRNEPTRCLRKMSENTCYVNTSCQFLGNIPGFGEACLNHNEETDDINLQAWRQQNPEQIREYPICYSSNHNVICTAINACAVGNRTIDLSSIMQKI